MIRKILAFLLLGMLTSCIAQKKYKTKSNSKEIMIPKVDKKFEMFDSHTYDRLYKLNPYNQSEFLLNGFYIEMNKSTVILSYSIIAKDSYFSISKGYYLNEKIKTKGLMYNNNSFQKGIWYEFDESGNLIKETDYDNPYQFTFEEIVKFCENEKIPLQKGPILQSTGYHTVIRRNFNSEGSWWQIEWLKKPNIIEIITLDGNSGKVLKRQYTEYTNN